MAKVEVTAVRDIGTGADAVFAAVADYEKTRPRILSDHFSEYEVHDGGQGAGTRVHWKLRATQKRVRDCLLTVTEPRVGELVETDANSSMVTTWTAIPASEGRTRVRIHTVWDGASGVAGFFERTFAPKGLSRIYDEMLANLAMAVQA